MKIQELREMSVEQLNQEVADLKQELFNLRFRQATHQLDNPSELREVRRKIARCKTILRERELKATAPQA